MDGRRVEGRHLGDAIDRRRGPVGVHRRFLDRLRIAASLLLASALAGCWPAPTPPNVILITVDTLRADRLHFMG